MTYRLTPISFTDRTDKARFMERRAIDDADRPTVQYWAKHVAGGAQTDRQKVARVLRFCQWSIRYGYDPGRQETLEDAETVLSRGWTDCDGKVRIFVALCTAAGVAARVHPVFTGDTGFPHVQATAWLADEGKWTVVDPSVTNAGLDERPSTPRVNDW